ncbi:MAG: winged helix-turn-helix domain-containing protein [Acidobacteria bacterium]|nr:winged helix-turn-helix domain-containing protein [Acidobacteriota bacterium]
MSASEIAHAPVVLRALDKNQDGALEEEKAFLAPWAEQARGAGVLVVSPLRAALAEKLGRKKVAASVVYRLLARHGWRKVAPDTRHPKSDPAAQAEWKKNFRKRWLPC